MDVRHQKRTAVIQELYAHSFFPDKVDDHYSFQTKEIIRNTDKLNDEIQKFASKFPVAKIAKVDLAILQLSVYELIIEKREHPKVIINEEVELAKELGSDRSFAFINAILGKIYTSMQTNEKQISGS